MKYKIDIMKRIRNLFHNVEAEKLKEFKYVIKDKDGIHARPAGLFIKEATVFPCTVTISKGDKEVDAKRILGVMGLGVKCGEEITVKTEGEKEEEAIQVLSKFLEENL